MKNIFTSNEEKITDKAFFRFLLTSVLGILVCIICLCSTTFAWFSTDMSSRANTLESAHFSLDVLVTDTNGDKFSATQNTDGTMTCNLEAVGEYEVTLSITGNTTATKGYCDISANNGETKRTSPISRDPNIGSEKFTFTIKTTEPNTTVTFTPKWGEAAHPNISNGDEYTMVEIE